MSTVWTYSSQGRENQKSDYIVAFIFVIGFYFAIII